MSENPRRSQLSALLGTIGVAFAASGLTLWFSLYHPRTTELNQLVLGVVVHVLFGYIVVMSGIVIYQSDLRTDECLLATKRCLGGAALMGALVVWRAVPELRSGAVTLAFLNEFVIVSSVGAAAGALIGINRGRARQNQRLVGRKDGREETLVFLLQLLDHDIQNHLTAISSYADTIDPSVVDSRVDPVDGIQDRTADIEQLLTTANAVIESETNEGEFERIDLSNVLREQLTALQSDAPGIKTKTRIADDLFVESNQFIDEVFHNLLDNAVIHNTTEELTIAVSATETNEGIVVDITDDGGGVPDQIRAEIFDPGVRADGSDGDGLGLYLVKKLVESYGGRIGVADRSPTGTRFRLWFPKG